MSDNNELDERKQQILKAIIDDYIQSMEPVGSRTIEKKHDFGLSSATIRNEMADLEEMGYLSSPHRSAGRVPSAKGYRLYVDKMLTINNDPHEVSQSFIRYLENRIGEFNEVIKVASEMVAELTKYASIATTSHTDSFAIKAVQIVPVETGRALVVAVAENNLIKNKLVEISPEIGASEIIKLSSVINESFSGKPASCITLEMINVIVERTGMNRDSILPIVDCIFECIKECETSEIYTSGDSNLLTHPEFTDINKAREVIDLIHSDKIVSEVLDNVSADGEITVKIGSENELSQINDCSVVTATYKINDASIGTISVIGPVRMDYEKVISALEFVRNAMNDKLKENNKDKNREMKR